MTAYVFDHFTPHHSSLTYAVQTLVLGITLPPIEPGLQFHYTSLTCVLVGLSFDKQHNIYFEPLRILAFTKLHYEIE